MKMCGVLLLLLATAFVKCSEHKFMLPYERTTIDDCLVRFFKDMSANAALPVSRTPAYLREFAHIAAIGWTQQTDGAVVFRCGGSLIWENFILTAAHCAEDESGTAPDVARMGDLNIYSDKDDQFAQQLRIVDVIRHPKHRFGSAYYDMALMKLERNITVHDTVSPTCLWLDDEIRFPKLLSAGWGATGFGKEATDILLKVELTPLSNDECSAHHKPGQSTLRDGLVDHQLCAGDVEQDTCPGDSGGPLHVKLFKDFKLTPFLVGVTSFGKACGFGLPGVYSRVSKFGDWIIETLQRHGELATAFKFHPLVCTERYYAYREYHEEIAQAYDGIEVIDADRTFMEYEPSKRRVDIRWPASVGARTNCSGTLIEPDVVLTLAECASHQGKSPSTVILSSSEVIQINNSFVHPRYNPLADPYYNNIAVLKLLTFASILPACGWYKNDDLGDQDARIRVTGKQLIPEEGLSDPVYTPLITRNWVRSQKDCHLARQYSSALSRGLQNEHFCFHNEPFVVPGTCELEPGAPIERLRDPYNTVFALNLFGRDCGFGEPAVAVRLSSHKSWLESVLLPRSKDAIVYIDPDLHVNDTCHYADGTDGVCISEARCPGFFKRLLAEQPVLFCRTKSVVCCPLPVSNGKSSEIEKEFNECEQRYHQMSEDRANNRTHIVKIGWRSGPSAPLDGQHCTGYLISTRGVVTAASCLLASTVQPNAVHLGEAEDDSSSVWHSIEKTVIHPGYDGATNRHNIAIVKLTSPVEPTAGVFPGCLWQNITHSPVKQEVWNVDGHRFEPIHPMYKSDCEARLQQPFAVPEMICMNPGLRKYTAAFHAGITDASISSEIPGRYALPSNKYCYTAGSPIVWRNYPRYKTIKYSNGDEWQQVDGSFYIEHLVNVYSHGDCDPSAPRLVNRVATYIDWFKEVLQ